MTSVSVRKYWFPAKRYGWGWGMPTSWQGWVVIVTYFALVLGGIPLVQVPRGNLAYGVYASAFTGLLIGICWLTGEPPSWRRERRGD